MRAAILRGEGAVALGGRQDDHVLLLGAGEADYALDVDREGARLLTLAQLNTEVRPSLDPATSMRRAPLAAAVTGVANAQVWRLGELGVAAMLVGIAEAALDLIVDYAKVRETFGKKIGAWQAVRHPCADMAVRVEAARSQLWFAAAAMNEGRDDADTHLDAAKHLANHAALANADSNIQLHGGIGVTDEHNAHLLLKHALVLARLFGSRRTLLARLLEAAVTD